MRTTLNLDDDVAAELDRLRREQGMGMSQAVNQLVRRGMVERASKSTYEHRSVALGLKVDITNVGAVLDLLDEA